MLGRPPRRSPASQRQDNRRGGTSGPRPARRGCRGTPRARRRPRRPSTASSIWSTTRRVGGPTLTSPPGSSCDSSSRHLDAAGHPAAAPGQLRIGCRPGRITTCRHAALPEGRHRRAPRAHRPAGAEDLPSRRCRRWRGAASTGEAAISSATRCSRPANQGGVADVVGRRGRATGRRPRPTAPAPRRAPRRAPAMLALTSARARPGESGRSTAPRGRRRRRGAGPLDSRTRASGHGCGTRAAARTRGRPP